MRLRLLLLLVAVVASSARAHGIQLAAGGAWMANLNNELRVGATDLQLSWRHDLAWSALEAGVEWMLFFPAGRADPMVGARVGWSVFKDLGPVRPRGGVSVGAYWTRVSPVLPVGYVDLALEKPLGPWTLGVQVSGMLSLFGAGVQPRLFIGRTF
ncbi:MAG: hypothetical protein JNJ54_29905 [Myxococcaceae bacterium]|nr:hypothetical protein [Myxococcaceae bacterium]